MRANKQSAPVMIACVIAAMGTAAFAGGNNLGTAGSALDPNNYVAPTTPRAARSAPISEQPEEIQSTTTFVTMPGMETPPSEKPQKQPKAAKVAKVKSPASHDGGDGMISEVGDKFKSTGAGIASGTKAAGDQMKKGTKAMGDGIASGAKASGNFFMKGARAIGSGTKKMGSKMAEGAKAAGDTMKDGTHAVADHMPFTGKSGKGEAPAPKAVASKQDDLKPRDGGDKFAAAPEPKTTIEAPKSIKQPKEKSAPSGKPGLVGKTLGSFNKFNVFHKKDNDGAVLETAGKAPAAGEVMH